MKKIIAVMLFISTFGFSQNAKELGDFNEIKVFDRINVELIPSSENKIEITGNRKDDVEIINKNGTLKIRMSFKKLLDGEEITAKLYFKNLESVDASEGSYIICDAIFKQTTIEIIAKEGAQIKLKLDVEKVKIKAVTGAIVKVSGGAVNQDASVGTGGILEAQNLITSQTTVTITTGGEADVRASVLVDAKVKAGGEITIYGSPKQINKKTLLGGTIQESNR
jgi:hypothetical protein